MDLGRHDMHPENPRLRDLPMAHALSGKTSWKARHCRTFPKKTPKKPKPVRHGTAICGAARAMGHGCWKPAPTKGCLGGMLGLARIRLGRQRPMNRPAAVRAADRSRGLDPAGTVRCATRFTHFHLISQRFAQPVTDATTCPERKAHLIDPRTISAPPTCRQSFARPST